MPHPPTAKGGSGKKASGAVAAMRGKDHPRSRTTTPNPVAPPSSSASSAPVPPPPPPSARLPTIETVDTDYLEIRVEQFRNLRPEDLIDQPGLPSTVIPDSKSIDALIARLQRLQETIERRNMFFDRGMRMLVQARKNRIPDEDEDAVPSAAATAATTAKKEEGGDDIKAGKADRADKKARHKKRKADALAPGDANLGRCFLCAAGSAAITAAACRAGVVNAFALYCSWWSVVGSLHDAIYCIIYMHSTSHRPLLLHGQPRGGHGCAHLELEFPIERRALC
jgi:hypothetical protein